MKVLVDTNILLDIALERSPFLEKSALFLKTARQQHIRLTVTPATIMDLYYFIRKAKGRDKAIGFLESLLRFADVGTVNKQVVLQALRSEISDFEDAIQAYSAKHEAINIIVTRNEGDFKKSDMDIYSPESFLKSLSPDIEPLKQDNQTEPDGRVP